MDAMPERYIQPLRLLIQSLFMIIALSALVRFILFLSDPLHNSRLPAARPELMDSFLPMSALNGLVFWLKTGTINLFHPVAVLILLAAITVSFLCRRGFCSWICLIGSISEWLWKSGFARNRRNIRLPVKVDRLLRAIKYLIMLYLLLAAFFTPHLLLQRKLEAERFADASLVNLLFHPSITFLLIIILFTVTSIHIRNPFCRYLCPFGALFSVYSILSPLAVRRDRKKCVSCGVCNQACPSGIDIMGSNRVNSPECIGCWRCISHCRVNRAVYMGVAGKWRLPGIIFVIMLLATFCFTMTIGKKLGYQGSVLTPADYADTASELNFKQ